MPTRWFQDNTLSKVDLASNELFIEALSKSLKKLSNNSLQQTYSILKHYKNIQEDKEASRKTDMQIKKRILKDIDNPNYCLMV
ncbi:7816_t:CDS:2, partial [Dentiscutata erythropus]